MSAPTLGEVLRLSRRWLADRGVENPARAADELAARVLGCRRLDLYLAHERPVDEEERGRLRDLLRRRAGGEPLQYLLGSQPFRHADLAVDSRVLIPRPETEELVELVLAREGGRPGLRILDAGTGSGCLAISLAQELAGCRVVAVDASPEALILARENAERNGVAARIAFVRLNLLQAWPSERADLLVSNPPYVPLRERGALARELAWEPEEALFAGDDGLVFYRRFAGGLDRLLVPGGRFYLEFGDGQERALMDIFAPCAAELAAHPDLSGRPRFVSGRRPA